MSVTIASRAAVVGKYVSLAVASVVTLLPLGVAFITSLKTERESANGGPLDLPHDWLNLHNFAVAFNQGHMLLAFVNTAIILAISITNDFYTPFLYMPSKDLGVISTSLFYFKGPYGAHWEIICAGAVLAIVPTLVVFLFLQRFVYNGFTMGSTK